MIRSFLFLLSLTLVVGLLTTPASAGDTPLTAVRVASLLDRPVFACSPPGDYERLFIVEQRGRIRILNLLTGVVQPINDLFLNIDNIVTNISGSDERGLLGLAFHPDYANNGDFYVYYTNNGSDTTVRRYGTDPGDPNKANLADSTILLTIDQPFSNHNGGWIGFGPDGYLYIATGDGGSFNDPGQRSQDITNQLLGKMLRIDVDGPSPTYDIPGDNPFVGVSGDDEIWAYGLRNPWRCSFDRETGDLWIGDVGQDAREEVDFQPASSPGGENYGWDCMEGNICGVGPQGCTCNSPTLTDPIQVYNQGGNGCTVVGGYVYRGLAMPNMNGIYFYGDYCSSRIWSFVEVNGSVTQFQERTAELEPEGAPTLSNSQFPSFGEDAFGELYLVDRGSGQSTTGGELHKILPANYADLDCNQNFIIDSTEIEVGLAPDCNDNGVIDSCDIENGTSTDANMNGIPDECEEPIFKRGDCNNDANYNISDPILLLDHLFGGMGVTVDCDDACDFSDDNGLGLEDAVGLLTYLFSMGPAPVAPFPDCGEDPTADGLGCDGYDQVSNCP